MKKHTAAVWAGILIAVYILTILPMLGVSFYAHPAHDDYAYSDFVYHALTTGEESVISAAFRKVKDFYLNWQGTYSAAFLMALQPGAFSQELYFLTTFVMLGMLTAGTFVFARTLMKHIIGQTGAYALSLAAAVMILSVQFAPDVHQGFYWWNGSMLYVFFYGLSLVYFSLLIRLFKAKKKAAQWTLTAVLCVLSVLVAGSNFSTALFTCEITVLSALYAFFKKKRIAPQMALVLLVMLAAFSANVLAPGNFVRAEEYSGMNPVIACAYSVGYGAYCLLRWMRLPVIACLLAFTPVFIEIAKKTSLRYRYPVFAIGFAVLLFSSQLAPSFYAMGTIGPGRQKNIYHASALWIYMFSWFYLIGWAVRRGIRLDFIHKAAKKKALCAIALSVMIALGCLLYGIGNLPAYRTAISLVSGEAKDYDIRYNRMLDDIRAADKVCVTEGMDEAPPFLSPVYLSEDPDFWVNNQMEGYFGLDEIMHK